MYWDRWEGEIHVPERDDLVFGPVALYEVVDVFPVESVIHPDRWRLHLRRIGFNGPDLLSELAARPGTRAHGERIRNEAWLHDQRAAQVAELTR